VAAFCFAPLTALLKLPACSCVNEILSLLCGEQKRHNPSRVKYWEIISDNLSEAGWCWGCVAAVDSQGRMMFTVDAHRDGKHFIVRADERLTAFVETESAIRAVSLELTLLRNRS
jgi:hypothetical protein